MPTCMQFLNSEVTADYYTRPPGIVSLLMLTITYTQAALHIHTLGRLINYTACSLYMIMLMATSVKDVIKMGNIVPRAGL